jgi:hypothetical protein
MPVDSSFMALGLAKPTLQIQIVSRNVRFVAASEQPWPEAPHQLGEMLAYRVLLALELVAQPVESHPTFAAPRCFRVQELADAAHLIRMESYFLEGLLCQGTPSINTRG